MLIHSTNNEHYIGWMDWSHIGDRGCPELGTESKMFLPYPLADIIMH